MVRVTSAEVNWLKETWVRQWQRRPDDQELRGLVTDYLKEKLLAHEARELGLDENDTVVRRRLAQKMEFLVQDTARVAEPVEDELRQVYAAHRDNYTTPVHISFHQIYFKSEPEARQGLKDIQTSGTGDVGDPILLEREYIRTDEQTVTSLFGPKFAERVFTLESGPWQGPIESGYGFHLVRIGERVPAELRPFEEVRSQVVNEWHRSQQAKIQAQFFSELLKKYDIIVDESVKPLMGPPGNMEMARR
ncbi:peptidylprolyl isomerase [Candidatus Nitrospira allomarina]|uniref:Peptidylprolyl isomerase n=1 Tax=Candidatus Nitrospira allomarina TaxID=3020900 RepID=A0AA96GA45_9BACT|nr:peptidylprolyl isomerase [Candidatus Nitrospira allomarina]WNM57527.1 peptidylprolyl isomerase [Candidatus Nitrospira allomarina]